MLRPMVAYEDPFERLYHDLKKTLCGEFGQRTVKRKLLFNLTKYSTVFQF